MATPGFIGLGIMGLRNALITAEANEADVDFADEPRKGALDHSAIATFLEDISNLKP